MEQNKAGLTAYPAPSGQTRPLIVGTRGSKLALWQTNWLVERLRETHPDLQVETKIITTQGDRIQDRPLQSINNDGFFVRELEDALFRGEIDLAVHSLKDLPHAQPEGLVVPVAPGRVDARDALISKNNLSLADLPQGAVIGTSSTRRASQLLAVRPDFTILPLRGNVDTRMRKLQEGSPENYDAIILAAAGLERLGRSGEITEMLPYSVMLPAPGQGALAPECRSDDSLVLSYLSHINELAAQAAVAGEKTFMAALGGGCQTPVGCYLEVVGQQIVGYGYVGRPDGSRVIKVELAQAWDGSLQTARDLGAKLAGLAQEQGAKQILDEARAAGFVTERK
ncbi:MAG: Porphobilinogen deaminase [Chloroflexi bacterium]|jgi:hydroxymethylbilane synthase|nr:Porphobilinogen deaminase [Chloroflexota bacterium]